MEHWFGYFYHSPSLLAALASSGHDQQSITDAIRLAEALIY